MGCGLLLAAVLVALLGSAPVGTAAAATTDAPADTVASAVILRQPDPELPADYTTGPYADRLCPTTPAASVTCSTGRTVLAVVQGAGHRERAVEAGATCEVQGGLWVCFEVRSLLVQRGGTTYGDTFLTPDARRELDPGLLEHEAEHVRQWRLFGPDFSVLYLREGVEVCGNYFEEQAGLAAGGYSCG